MKFGPILYKILNQRGIAIKEFSRRTGISEASISRYINGEVMPGYKHIETICNTLNVGVDVFFPDVKVKLEQNEELYKCETCMRSRNYRIYPHGILYRIFSDPQNDVSVYSFISSGEVQMDLKGLAKGYLQGDESIYVETQEDSKKDGDVFSLEKSELAYVPSGKRVSFIVSGEGHVDLPQKLERKLSYIDKKAKAMQTS
jgi:transcriptional regulator with XRE-family HTH domain